MTLGDSPGCSQRAYCTSPSTGRENVTTSVGYVRTAGRRPSTYSHSLTFMTWRRPASLPIGAQHEAILLQAIVAGKTLLRRRRHGQLRLAVLDESLKPPAARLGEALRVFHHHVELPARALLIGPGVVTHLEPLE